ncbi:MAG: hypothetical protein LBK68_01465 [Candidatus Margulisbacteria bacterium]|nr:hypothetical protein [Candidatus Margulisiibacteriota bacterium]
MANAGNYTDTTDTDFKGASYNIDTGKRLSAEGMRNALHTKEKVANKQVDSTDAAGTLSSSSSDSYYPTSKLVGKNLDALSTTISTGLSAVNTSLNGKQDKIGAGTANDILTKTTTAGTLGTLTKTTSVAAAASASDDKIPTEKAVATALSSKLSASDISNLQEKLPIGTILMYDGANWADNSTLPGWYSCISTNVGKGCPNLVDSFIKGTDSATRRGSAGNTGNEVTIGASNLPTHTHSVSIDTDTKGAHRHGLRSTTSDLNEAAHGFQYNVSNGTNKNAIPVGWAYNISTDYYETFRESPSSSAVLYAMSETGGHKHNVSGNTGNNTTTAAKLNIEPQSYKLIYIRKCE